jgi:hypothetical protein
VIGGHENKSLFTKIKQESKNKHSKGKKEEKNGYLAATPSKTFSKPLKVTLLELLE